MNLTRGLASLSNAHKAGFDRIALRDLRRRDFPPQEHHTVRPGRRKNKHAERFVRCLTDVVVTYVEETLLGFDTSKRQNCRRAIIGASYSAVVALQALMWSPRTFHKFVLGSPSVCFDPEILTELDAGRHVEEAVAAGVEVLILLGALEREGLRLPGNVHDDLPAMAEVLSNMLVLQGLSLGDMFQEIPFEDHTSVKLSIISRGMAWCSKAWHLETHQAPVSSSVACDSVKSANSPATSGVASTS